MVIKFLYFKLCIILGVGGFIVRQRSRQWLAKRQASYEEQDDPEKSMF